MGIFPRGESFSLCAGDGHARYVCSRLALYAQSRLAIVRGALSLLFPNKMYGVGETILASRSGTMSGAVIVLVLGGIQSWMGYRDLLKK